MWDPIWRDIINDWATGCCCSISVWLWLSYHSTHPSLSSAFLSTFLVANIASTEKNKAKSLLKSLQSYLLLFIWTFECDFSQIILETVEWWERRVMPISQESFFYQLCSNLIKSQKCVGHLGCSKLIWSRTTIELLYEVIRMIKTCWPPRRDNYRFKKQSKTRKATNYWRQWWPLWQIMPISVLTWSTCFTLYAWID